MRLCGVVVFACVIEYFGVQDKTLSVINLLGLQVLKDQFIVTVCPFLMCF